MNSWWRTLFLGGAAVVLAFVALIGLASAVIYPSLPSLEALTDYRPKMPLRVYAEDGGLLGEFGEEKRSMVRLAETPLTLRQAILAAEDERFYEHGGVDTLGVLRAALANVMAGGTKEGASTITMQVARNFFLSSEKTFRRKLNEALLAIKIEHALSKDQILELYINQIYLGQRAYGFAAAAQTYFGKVLGRIDLAEAAMLAGLPKAPSAYNPVVNPSRAKTRQLYVLKRMRELGFISEADYRRAKDKRLQVRFTPQGGYEASAGHVAEMARQYMYEKYGDQIYVSGMKVYTTIRTAEQKAAEEAVRAGVVAYNRRRGYSGPEGQVSWSAATAERDRAIGEALARDEVNGLLPAVVVAIDGKHIRVRLRSAEEVELGSSEVRFAQPALAKKVAEGKRLKPGSVVRVVRLRAGQPWQLTYLPQVEAAFVAMSPDSGAIRALVGGFDFSRNQFNHVTQAWRQPGSAFKPFVYSAALERGVTAATIFDDAPISVSATETSDEFWEPKNYDGTMDGPISVRTALTKSKNLVSIRILQAIGADVARDHALRFGFSADRISPYLTLALGASEVTPLQLVTGYAVFASGGLRPKPNFLARVTDKDGRVLEAFQPAPAERVLDSRNAFIMTSMMQDVVRHGTAAAANRLGRSDLAGKTGTTSDNRDTWFAGYNGQRVAVAWMGFDQPRAMGSNETGGLAALPIWMGYMAVAQRGKANTVYPVPDGVATVMVDPATGRSVLEGGVAEYFYAEFTPPPADGYAPLYSPEGTVFDGAR